MSQVIMRVATGRWLWYPELQCVDFVPKGRPPYEKTITLPLTHKHNTLVHALKAIIQQLSEEIIIGDAYSHIIDYTARLVAQTNIQDTIQKSNEASKIMD